MGKPTGFLEFQRDVAPCRAPGERVLDFCEFKKALGTQPRREQAARCMNCGVPFCQSGEKFGRAVSGCPLHNLIPEWNDLIYKCRDKEALARLTKVNPFPEFTGRVCPALCEAGCTCGLNGEPVTVRDNELYLSEYGFGAELIRPCPPEKRSGRKVAIIGSGPAGLAAAYRMNRLGHYVTVYERADRAGGLLTYGIPCMKLDKAVVERRISLMESEGVGFVLNADIGAGRAEEILREYDAVVLCCGAKKPRNVNFPGREGKGIHYAVDYLSSVTETLLGGHERFPIDASGKSVVVIGGGDTGNDCVGTAIRQGCKSVVQLEMMPCPPQSRAPGNARKGQRMAAVAEYTPHRLRAAGGASRFRRRSANVLHHCERGAGRCGREYRFRYRSNALGGRKYRARAAAAMRPAAYRRRVYRLRGLCRLRIRLGARCAREYFLPGKPCHGKSEGVFRRRCAYRAIARCARHCGRARLRG